MSAAAAARQRKIAYFAWMAVCIIWGTTYFGIRVSLESMPPALMGGLRWTIAGALLGAYVVATGGSLPLRARWGSISLLAFLLIGLGNGGVVFAEQWIPSGLAAVLVACSPFWMAAVEGFLPDGERLRPGVLGGLLVGFSGIVILVWPALTFAGADHSGFLRGVVALQIAAFGWSLGSSYAKRQGAQDNVLGATALQMFIGGLILTALGTARGEWSSLFFTNRTTVALVYLATIGSIGGFVAYIFALRFLPVSFVSLYAYINPIIAVALGVAFLGEPFTARMAVAAGFVFAGVAVVRWQRPGVLRPAPAVAVERPVTAARRIA